MIKTFAMQNMLYHFMVGYSDVVVELGDFSFLMCWTNSYSLLVASDGVFKLLLLEEGISLVLGLQGLLQLGL